MLFHPYSGDHIMYSRNHRLLLIMKMTAFWYIVLYNLVEVDRRFRGTYCFHHHRPDKGGSTRPWNVGLLQRDYKPLYPRRLTSSYSPPRGLVISRSLLTPKFYYLNSRTACRLCSSDSDVIQSYRYLPGCSTLKMEAIRCSETLVTTYRTVRCHNFPGLYFTMFLMRSLQWVFSAFIHLEIQVCSWQEW
jgi:hypothetical protein